MRESIKKALKQVYIGFRQSGAQLKIYVYLVVVPTVFVFLYLLFWHSAMYETETKFAVRSASDVPVATDFASILFNPLNSSVQDLRIVNEYVNSQSIYQRIDDSLDLTGHYSSKEHDFYSRLTSRSTLRERQEYWKSVSSTSLDPDSGILTFQVRAYSPEMAKKISDLVIQYSEDLVNQMNERAREDTLNLAQKEVTLAQEKVAKTQTALEKFRGLHEDIDLKSTAGGLQSLVLQLEGERAVVEAQIKELESYMNKNAPAIQSLRKKASAISQQLQSEKKRLSTLDSDKSLNAQVAEFEKLTLEHEFAQKQLLSAMAALESARIQVLSKSRYVVAITKGQIADESTYPRVFVFTLIFGLILSLIYAIGSLIVASVKEHVGY